MELKPRIEEVMRREGWDKFTDNPKDKGGPTRWGITETTARAWGYQGNMALLPYETAYAIYVNRFWKAPKFDEVAKISDPLATAMFDFGVNSGPPRAVKALQRALNVLNRQAKDYPDISADGVIGNMTLYALKMFIAKRGIQGSRDLTEIVIAFRRVFLVEIAEKDESQEEFENGWQSRVSESK